MIRLEIPNLSYKQDYLDCVEEWGKVEKIPTDPDNFFHGDSYEEFLEYTEKNRINPDKGRVLATLFLVYDVKNLVGALDIRHHIDHDFLSEIGGHIGYGVAPKYRQQGYATKILAQGLIEAKKLGIEKVLLTCKDGNIASQKVIEKNGGVFDRFTKWDNMKVRRYWIDIS